LPDVGAISAADFRASFGEDLADALNLATWAPGDLVREYERIAREVAEAVRAEGDVQQRLRQQIFPQLREAKLAPCGSGVFEAQRDQIERLHRGLLFGGGVETCDGTVAVHDTLPLTVYQIGVGMVSYRGNLRTWHQRLFRRDLRLQSDDPVEEARELLLRRARRAAVNHPVQQDALGALAQRALMTYAERAILLRHSQAPWRMGHGNPVPYELLTGAGCLELMTAATAILRELIEGHRKFVFVASEPRERLLLSIGQALRPLEYAIVGTLQERLGEWVWQARFSTSGSPSLKWDGEELAPHEWIPRFIKQVGPQVVIGLFRATRLAPAHLFYAHPDHAHEAAHIALADSVLEEQRGFPMLITLADHLCKVVFGGTLDSLTDAAYSAAGAPCRYASERKTRTH
jgi:hypothetical protein